MARKLGILILCAFLALVLPSITQGGEFPGATDGQRAPVPTSDPEVAVPTPQPRLPMNGATPGSLQPNECGGRCTVRCSGTAYKKPCMFFCQKCCAKCLCVPPGTYGNKQFCPCYNSWKTKRGGPKCP